MPIVLATAPTIPIDLISCVFMNTWKICHSMTYWCVHRQKRNTRIIFVFCVYIPTLEEALYDVFEDKFYGRKNERRIWKSWEEICFYFRRRLNYVLMRHEKNLVMDQHI